MKKKLQSLFAKFKKKPSDESPDDDDQEYDETDVTELEDDEEFEDEDEEGQEDDEEYTYVLEGEDLEEKVEKPGLFAKLKAKFSKSSSSEDEEYEEEEEEDDEFDEDTSTDVEIPLPPDESLEADSPPLPKSEEQGAPPSVPPTPSAPVEGTAEFNLAEMNRNEESDEDNDSLDDEDEDYAGNDDTMFTQMPKPSMEPSEASTGFKGKLMAGLGGFGLVFKKIKSKFLKKGSSEEELPESLSSEETNIGTPATESKGGMTFKHKMEDLLTNFDVHTVNSFFAGILSPAFRPQINKAFLIGLTTVLTYGSAKVLALLLQGDNFVPSTPIYIDTTQLSPAKVSEVLATNPFNVLIEPIKKKGEKKKVKKKVVTNQNVACLESKTPSRLPLKLQNTVVLQDSVKSVASVQMKGKNEVLNLREGDRLKGMLKVGRIGRQEVVFRNLKTGRCERLFNLDKGPKLKKPLNIVSPEKGQEIIEAAKPKGIESDGNKFTISRKLLKQKLSNINEVLTQARAIQVDNPDGTLSFKMTEVVPGSIYTFIGIQNGDKISQINGKPINSLNEIFDLFGKLQKVDELTLNLQRDGEDQTLEYNFTDK